jgi:hypothetical protein
MSKRRPEEYLEIPLAFLRSLKEAHGDAADERRSTPIGRSVLIRVHLRSSAAKI